MATHTVEEMLSHSAAVTQRERNVGDSDVNQASAVMLATDIPPGRRCEARMDYRQVCLYEVLEPIEGKSVIIEQGEAFVLNWSTEGILLFMGQAPQEKQMIKLHSLRFGWSRAVNVFETRWSRPVQVESFGNLYLIGCRRMFGPCQYLSF